MAGLFSDPVSASKSVSVPASGSGKSSLPKRTFNLIHHTAIHLRSDICTYVIVFVCKSGLAMDQPSCFLAG